MIKPRQCNPPRLRGCIQPDNNRRQQEIARDDARYVVTIVFLLVGYVLALVLVGVLP